MKKITFIYFFILFAVWNSSSYAQRVLTIDEAIHIALNNNPAIRINRSQIKEADAKHAQAYSSFLPQAEVISKYFYTNNTSGLFPVEGSIVPVMDNGIPTGDDITMHAKSPFPILDRDVLTLDFNVIYPLYMGGKRKNALESTNALKEVYQKDLKDTEGFLSLNVKTAFYNVLYLEEMLNVFKETLDQLQGHYSIAEKAYKEGVRSEFDVLMFTTKIKEANSQFIELNGKKEVALSTLKSLLNMTDTVSPICKGSIQINTKYLNLPSEQMLDTINAGNNKLLSFKAMKDVMSYKEKIDAADNLPNLVAFSNYHIYHGQDTPPFDVAWRQGYSIGLSLKINLFDGNMMKGKVQETKAGIEKTIGYEESYKLQIRTKYTTSVQHISSLVSQKESALSNMDVANKALEIAGVGFKNGVITSIELNDAQINITKVKTQLLSIEKDILLEQANLQYLRGEIF
jgi:outer membrane protein